jgi:nucleoside-diphosphate-sugar epimerase
VTGATGFIGRTLVPRLTRHGWRVRALVRSLERAAALQNPEVELIAGSLQHPESLHRLTQGVAAVVHCAGAVRGATPAQFDGVNVDGVVAMVRAAQAQDRRPRFLSLSSLAAREPHLSAYAASKRRGEEVLASSAQDLPWAAFRPPAVYGPGDKELLPLFRTMARGIAPVPGSSRARFSVIFVEDLVDAIIAWLEHPTPVHGLFELHDGHPGGYSWEEVIALVEQLAQRRVRRVPVPTAVLQVPALINALAGRLRLYAPMLTPGKVRELTHPDWVCDNATIHGAIGWEPAVPLREGLLRTPGWLPD